MTCFAEEKKDISSPLKRGWNGNEHREKFKTQWGEKQIYDTFVLIKRATSKNPTCDV